MRFQAVYVAEQGLPTGNDWIAHGIARRSIDRAQSVVKGEFR